MMKLSFGLICDELLIPKESISDINKRARFGRVRFYDGSEAKLESGTIYIADSNHPPAPDLIIEKGAGVLSLGSVPPLACPTAIISHILTKETLLHQVLSIFEEYASWNSALNDALLNACDLQTILDIAILKLRNPAYLVDSSFKVLAINNVPSMSQMSVAWKFLTERGYLDVRLASGMELNYLDSVKEAVFFTSKMFYNEFISYGIRVNGSLQGRLFVPGMIYRFKSTDLELAEHVGSVIVKYIEMNSDFLIAQTNLYEHFLLDVLSGGLRDKQEISDKLALVGWKIDDMFCTIKIPVRYNNRPVRLLLNSRLVNEFDSRPVFYEDSIVATFKINEGSDLAKIEPRLESFLKMSLLYGGISEAYRGFLNFPEGYSQAHAACFFGNKKGGKTLYHYQDFFFSRVVSSMSQLMQLEAVIHPAVRILKKYDAHRSTELSKTLRAYLYNERSIAASALSLHIHRNTLLKRLDRINRLTKINLDEYQTRTRLLLSYHVEEYLCEFQADEESNTDEAVGDLT